MYKATHVQSHTLEKYRSVENILDYNEYLDFKMLGKGKNTLQIGKNMQRPFQFSF